MSEKARIVFLQGPPEMEVIPEAAMFSNGRVVMDDGTTAFSNVFDFMQYLKSKKLMPVQEDEQCPQS